MNWDDLDEEELLSRFLHLEERINKLEEKLIQKNEQAELIEKQDKLIEQQSERIEELEAQLRKYENPHTPPSKRRSGTDESPTEQDDEDDNVRTDGGTPGRKDGHDPEWRSPPDPDEEVDVTCDCCPECGEHFDESGADAHRLVEEIPDPQPPEVTQYNRHCYSATLVEQRQLRLTPTAPMRGSSG